MGTRQWWSSRVANLAGPMDITPVNADGSARLIALNTLQQRDQGPLHLCQLCTSKCLFRLEARGETDSKVLAEFNARINLPGLDSSEEAAKFCLELSKEMLGEEDVDLAHCLAAHLIEQRPVSVDSQINFISLVRSVLERSQLKEHTNSTEQNE